MNFVPFAAGACLACVTAIAGAQIVVVVEPMRTVVDPTITIGSMTPTSESPAAARKEAAAALAQARHDCRLENGRDAQASCLSAARDDYRQMMKSAGRPAAANAS